MFNATSSSVLVPNATFERDLLHMYMQRYQDNDIPSDDTDNSFLLNATHISLKTIERSFLVCIICDGRYVEPKILPCQHRFCKACLSNFLSNWQALNLNIRRVPCPKCKQPADFANGLDYFQTDRLIEDLTLLIDKYHLEAKDRGEKPSYDLPYRCGLCQASC